MSIVIFLLGLVVALSVLADILGQRGRAAAHDRSAAGTPSVGAWFFPPWRGVAGRIPEQTRRQDVLGLFAPALLLGSSIACMGLLAAGFGLMA